jgi:hypothetical protein
MREKLGMIAILALNLFTPVMLILVLIALSTV